jgi:CMP-N,N'-diacetyllegionaminic acid synthase
MFEGNPILCTICARGGSKGVPGKNARLLLGKPLIAWSVEQALAAGVFQHVVVSTDSEEIAQAAQAAGAELFFRRSAELSSDSAAKVPVIRDAFQRSEEHYGQRYRYHVDLDATAPLRDPADITNALDLFLAKDWDTLLTGMPSRRSPYFNLVEAAGDGRIVLSKQGMHLVRRQDSPKCYDLNASIYIWKREVLLNQDSVLLEKTGIYEMPEERSIDIDSETDFQFVEFMMQRKLACRL